MFPANLRKSLRRLCFWHGVAGFQDVAALAVASLDLGLVRLLRGAIRAADIESGAGRGVLVPEPVIEPRRHLTPEPEYLPRQKIHPTPLYEPRPIIHPTPRVVCEPCPPACPELPPPSFNPLPPPWKQARLEDSNSSTRNPKSRPVQNRYP